MSWFPYDTQTRRRLSHGLNASEATVNRHLHTKSSIKWPWHQRGAGRAIFKTLSDEIILEVFMDYQRGIRSNPIALREDSNYTYPFVVVMLISYT